MAALAVLGLVGAIVLIGFVGVAMRRGHAAALQQLAQPFGWHYERLHGHGLQAAIGVGHVLRGWVDGRAFELYVAPEGNQRFLSERWTIYLAGALPGGFAAGKNGLLRGTSAGMVRVVSGDEAFDKKVLCEGTDPAQAWLVLAAEPRKAALRDLAEMNAVVFANKLSFAKQGLDTNVTKLRARLDRLRSIAQAIDPVQPPMQPVAQPPPAQAMPPAPYPPAPGPYAG